MFNPKAFENSRPDGISLLEIIDGRSEEQPRLFAPLQKTELSGEIAGPLAALRLRQLFRFSSDQCNKVVEAVYRFPLPGDAAVTGVVVRFGDVEIRATLQERQKAEHVYQEAKAQGRQAALLTRESPDVFTLQVAGVAPNQDVVIETDYVQLARAEGAGWSLRIPLTTSPRYVREDEVASRHAQGQPLLLLRDPGHRFALDLIVTTATEVKSPTHTLVQATKDGKSHVRLEGGDVIPDRDCVFNWRPLQEAERPTFQVTLHDDPASGTVYFLGLLAPPVRKGGPGIPREVILLVDHSGSMQGAKWEAADWAVKRFFGELTERDSFALGLFHNDTTWFAKVPKAADAKTLASAIEFLDKHKDDGGTNLGVALEQALDLVRTSGDVARHILIITDAEVTDEGRILQLADREANETERRRIDVLCIDAAPNAFLARELAERGGGVAKFLTSAPEEEDISTALDEVLMDWTQPVVTGLRLEVNRDRVEASGRAVIASGQTQAIDLGDLPAGRSIWVMGRVPRSGANELAFRVLTPANRDVGSCRVNLSDGEGNDRPALKALFGARRILGLEFLISSGSKEFEDQLSRLGYDPREVLSDQPGQKAKLYAENAWADTSKKLHRLLVSEALHFGLASSETAFVAARTEAGKPVEGTVMVANALPAGWAGEFLIGGSNSTLGAACYSAPPSNAVASVDPMMTNFDFFDGGQDDEVVFRLAPVARVSQRLYAQAAAALHPPRTASTAVGQGVTLFAGVPAFEKGAAVLFDTDRVDDAKNLPGAMTLLRLQIQFPDGNPEWGSVDRDLVVLLYVDDLAAPRAKVRMTDLVRQGGNRPLNIARQSGQRVRIVLADSSGAWASAAPRLKLSLHWG